MPFPSRCRQPPCALLTDFALPRPCRTGTSYCIERFRGPCATGDDGGRKAVGRGTSLTMCVSCDLTPGHSIPAHALSRYFVPPCSITHQTAAVSKASTCSHRLFPASTVSLHPAFRPKRCSLKTRKGLRGKGLAMCQLQARMGGDVGTRSAACISMEFCVISATTTAEAAHRVRCTWLLTSGREANQFWHLLMLLMLLILQLPTLPLLPQLPSTSRQNHLLLKIQAVVRRRCLRSMAEKAPCFSQGAAARKTRSNRRRLRCHAGQRWQPLCCPRQRPLDSPSALRPPQFLLLLHPHAMMLVTCLPGQ